jgi:hypothetical protein
MCTSPLFLVGTMLQGAYQTGYTTVLQGCESCFQMLCMHNSGLCRLTRVTSFHDPRCGCGRNRDTLVRCSKCAHEGGHGAPCKGAVRASLNCVGQRSSAEVEGGELAARLGGVGVEFAVGIALEDQAPGGREQNALGHRDRQLGSASLSTQRPGIPPVPVFASFRAASIMPKEGGQSSRRMVGGGTRAVMMEA